MIHIQRAGGQTRLTQLQLLFCLGLQRNFVRRFYKQENLLTTRTPSEVFRRSIQFLAQQQALVKRRKGLGIRTRSCPARLTPNVRTHACLISRAISVAPQMPR
jgi:hypothetical protein